VDSRTLPLVLFYAATAVNLMWNILFAASISLGVAGYELTRDIPDRLKDSLPAPEELEEKILFELGLDENFSGK
jgi:hypothetical protein